ncbi:MAG: hypothetical protein FJ137_15665 [Deltaproteobacteria bacterium]|nr:hypothetical protein [Deltaproteobacteria bacterium]
MLCWYSAGVFTTACSIHRITLDVISEEMRRSYRAPTMVDVDAVDLVGDQDVAAEIEAAEAERLLSLALIDVLPRSATATTGRACARAAPGPS